MTKVEKEHELEVERKKWRVKMVGTQNVLHKTYFFLIYLAPWTNPAFVLFCRSKFVNVLLCFVPWSCGAWSSVMLPLHSPASPTSPREIKSYHLIDLSALDSPQTHRRANSSPLVVPFDSSALSSSLTLLPSSFSPPAPHLGSSLHSAADQEFTELGWLHLYSCYFLTHWEICKVKCKVMMPRPVFTGFDNLVLKPSHTQETPKTYYEELMQVRLESGVKHKCFCWLDLEQTWVFYTNYPLYLSLVEDSKWMTLDSVEGVTICW